MSITHAVRSVQDGRSFGIVGLLALCLLSLGSVRATAGGDTPSAAEQSLLEKTAEVMLNRLWHLPPRASLGGVTVCSAAEVDLDGDKRPELIAAVDYSGRRFCNTLAVMQRGSASAPLATDAWAIEDVESTIKRNKDGSTMLVIPTSFTDYEGVQCIATWQRLFKFQSRELVDVSAAYPNFYKTRKQQVAASIAKLDMAKADTSCAQIESDKLDRFLGTSPLAGYDRAVAWARSADPVMRKRAAHVFADIGDAGSMANLQNLARDADRAVAISARGGMEKARRGRK